MGSGPVVACRRCSLGSGNKIWVDRTVAESPSAGGRAATAPCALWQCLSDDPIESRACESCRPIPIRTEPRSTPLRHTITAGAASDQPRRAEELGTFQTVAGQSMEVGCGRANEGMTGQTFRGKAASRSWASKPFLGAYRTLPCPSHTENDATPRPCGVGDIASVLSYILHDCLAALLMFRSSGHMSNASSTDHRSWMLLCLSCHYLRRSRPVGCSSAGTSCPACSLQERPAKMIAVFFPTDPCTQSTRELIRLQQRNAPLMPCLGNTRRRESHPLPELQSLPLAIAPQIDALVCHFYVAFS